MPQRWIVVFALALCSPAAMGESAETMSLETFVEQYAAQESKDIIFTPRMKGTVQMSTPGSITKEEFHATLLAAHFCAYEDNGVINIVTSAFIRYQKVPFYDGQHRGDLVPSQTVIGFIELEYQSAQDLLPELKPMIELWGYIAADSRTNTLLAVTTLRNMERLIETADQLDH